MKDICPAELEQLRLNLDPAHRQLHVQPVSSPLYVVTAMFNPLRFASRYRLFHAFRKHVADAGAILYTIELALRDRHFEVTKAAEPKDIQVRGHSEIWYKENLQNVAMSYLPANAEYIAFVDADFHFTRADWATETVQMLQHHEAVQMFSNLTYETHDHRTHGTMNSFAYTHLNQLTIPLRYGHLGAVGGAWAFRRSALRKLGGLLDICILGSGDWHMAFAMAMREDYHPELTELRGVPEYVKAIRRWQENARCLNGNIGYVESHAIHHWHGPMAKRGYTTRPAILARHGYDPLSDLVYDENGVLQLRENKPKFRDEIRAYFRSRNEDGIDV
jgi:hypothetical protein